MEQVNLLTKRSTLEVLDGTTYFEVYGLCSIPL